MTGNIKAFCVSALFLGLSACLGSTEGISPPGDELIFPVAIATVNGDSHLLVVNSNFDLRYNAGTLVAFDLSLLDGTGEWDPQTGILTLPAGVSLDAFCDDVTSDTCTVDEAGGIDAAETIRLGAYASDLDVTPAGDRALIPVRGEQTIIMVDLLADGDLMDCGEGDDRMCDAAHRIAQDGSVSLPIEPYSVRTMDYVREEGGATVTETLGFVTHRAGGEVSLFSVARRVGDGPTVFENRLIKVIGGVVEGAAGIAVNPLSRDIYISGQRDPTPHVAVLRVETDLDAGGSYLLDPWFSQAATISIASQLYGGTDARRMAVSPDGTTGFILVQSPPSLLKVDLTRYEMTDMVTVCPETSQVKLFADEGDPADELDDRLYAFVSCFLTRQVYVIDTHLMTTVIRRTGEGPQDIAFDRTRQIAYVANFSESTISLMQAVPPFNQVRVRTSAEPDDLRILRIGEPQLPKGY
mgnify:CR=1 FL=1